MFFMTSPGCNEPFSSGRETIIGCPTFKGTSGCGDALIYAVVPASKTKVAHSTNKVPSDLAGKKQGMKTEDAEERVFFFANILIYNKSQYNYSCLERSTVNAQDYRRLFCLIIKTIA